MNCWNYGLNRFIILVYIGGADRIGYAAVIRICNVVAVVPAIYCFGGYKHLPFLVSTLNGSLINASSTVVFLR